MCHIYFPLYSNESPKKENIQKYQTGELKKLIQDARRYLIRKYPKQNKIQVELAKYQIWDMCDNLKEVFEEVAQEFFFVYYNSLNELFEIYAKFLRFDSVPAHKLRRFLVNEKDKKKYHVSDFPDKKFVKMFVKAMSLKDKMTMMKEYEKLTKYVLDIMGGFNIDGWKIRSPAG